MVLGKGQQCLRYSLFIPIYFLYASYTPLFRPGSGASGSLPWSKHESLAALLLLRGRQHEGGAKTPIVDMGGRIAQQSLPGQVHVVINNSDSSSVVGDRAAYTPSLRKVNSRQGIGFTVQNESLDEEYVSEGTLPEATSLHHVSGMSEGTLPETIPDHSALGMSEGTLPEAIPSHNSTDMHERILTNAVSVQYVLPIPSYVFASEGTLPEAATHTSFHKMHILIYLVPCVVAMCYIAHMMPQGGPQGGGDGSPVSYRVPPHWSPDRESRGYSFRNYITDLTLWIMLTDLAPHQQAAAIIMRLGGSAREMARTITPQEIIQGGVVNGVQLDPVSYIIHGLHTRFAQLGEESRLVAMTEMMSFHRLPNESINDVLTRYEVVRQRARNEGQFVMTIEGCALQLLRTCGVSTQQFMQVIANFGNRLPTTDEEWGNMTRFLRRMGHILEHSPGNIASTLHGGRAQRSHFADAFMSTPTQDTENFHNSPGWGDYGPHVDAWRDTGGDADLWRNLQPDYSSSSTGEGYGQTPGWMLGSNSPEAFTSWSSPGVDMSGQQQWFGQDDQYNWDPTADQHTFWQGVPELDEDSATDTDTSSDSGLEEVDMSDLRGMTDHEASELVYWQYRTAKKRWRRLTQRPVRRFRRFAKRFHRKGKGKGKGKGRFKGGSIFHVDGNNNPLLIYLKGKGKGKRTHTSGKGFGRRKNPRGRDGQIMKCRICNSEDHFQARCPQRNSAGSGGAGTPHLYAEGGSPAGPLSGVLDEQAHPEVQSTLHFMVFRRNERDELYRRDPWRGFTRHPQAASSSRGAAGSAPASSSGWRSANAEATPEPAPQPPAPPPPAQPAVPMDTTRTTDEQLQAILTGTASAMWINQQSRQQPRATADNRARAIGVPQSVHTIMQLGQPSTVPAPLVSGGTLPAATRDAELAAGGFGAFMPNNMAVVRVDNVGVASAGTLPEAAATTDLSNLQASIALRRARDQPNPPPTVEPGSGGTLPEAPAPIQTPDPPIPVIFDGDNRTCTICIQEFSADQRVIRLMCRHVFHGDCWTRYMMSDQGTPTIECPNCRGSGNLIAMWNYIDPTEITQPGATNLLSQVQGGQEADSFPTAAESRFSTPNSNLSMAVGGLSDMYDSRAADPTTAEAIRPPWLGDSETPHWVVLPNTWQDANEWTPQAQQGASSMGAYHIETRLPGNRPALIIDPGSVGNLGGDDWARSVAQAARTAGLRAQEHSRNRPLEVRGVGNGSQRCTHNCVLPIALNQANGQSRIGTFEAPIVGNSMLPGLLGLESLCSSRAVLDMVNMQLHLLGPADWRPEMPSGTETYSLVRAPSGHLALPCSEFREAQRRPPTTNSRQIALATTREDHAPTASEGTLPEAAVGDITASAVCVGTLPEATVDQSNPSSSL